MLSLDPINLFAINMDPKKMLLKEITFKFKGQLKEEIVTEKLDQFFRHGNTFLLIELISLRKEVKNLRKELEQQIN